MLRRLVWFVCVLIILPASVRADDVLTPAQAASQVGNVVTIHMTVRASGNSTGGFVDLLSEATPQHADAFFVRSSASAAQDKFKERKITDVRKYFNQQTIRATGTVKTVNYTGIGKRPIIEIETIEQIEIVDPDAVYVIDPDIRDLAVSGKLFQRAAYKEVLRRLRSPIRNQP